MGIPVVFLDRDGVLNRDGPGFVTDPADLHLLPRAAEAVALLNRAGFAAVVVTNQSCVGRGLLTEPGLEAIHARLRREVLREGGAFMAVLSCPHAPWDNCACRKPKAGMLRTAEQKLRADLVSSYMVGDKPTDIECGASAGCRTVLVLSGLEPTYERDRFAVEPDHVCDDLWEAAHWILADAAGRSDA